MSFDVPPDAYSRFMGRYAEPLAKVFATFAGVGAGDRVLDVGCGPGALTAHLLSIGAQVAGIDPSPPFVDAIRTRLPDVDVRLGTAEQLPYGSATFDAALAQLVVHFMTDPATGIGQLARVTRPGGVVAACVWDGPAGALAPFWDAVHTIAPDAEDEALLSGARRGHLTELFTGAGLSQVEEQPLTVDVVHPTFEQWWEPYTYGVGPAGAYVRQLDDGARSRLEMAARERLGSGPFTVTATAWAAKGKVGMHRNAMEPTGLVTNLSVPDLEEARDFYADFLGLSVEEFNLGWIVRLSSPNGRASVQLVTREATAPADSALSVHVGDQIEAAYEEAQRRGLEIVHPLTTEPWGVRRFFVRTPDGTVVNIVSHADRDG